MKKDRKKVDLRMTGTELLVLMSEGNPGAISVLTELMNHDDYGLMNILSLDDMNIRGSQIWVGYKDYCGQEIVDFIKAIKERSIDMVAAINKECANTGGHIAVKSGASFQRGASV